MGQELLRFLIVLVCGDVIAFHALHNANLERGSCRGNVAGIRSLIDKGAHIAAGFLTIRLRYRKRGNLCYSGVYGRKRGACGATQNCSREQGGNDTLWPRILIS